jgi:hypothetical protein
MYQDNQDKAKAVVIKTYTVGGILVKLTEKGAVTVYTKNQAGAETFRHCLRPSDVTIHAELGNPLFQEIIASPEWQALQHNKALNKEKQAIARQQAQVIGKAQQMFQASIDRLKLSGMSQEQAVAFLTGVKTA